MTAEAFAGSEAISTTEWSLPRDASYAIGSTQTSDGRFQVWLDLSDMVAGDELQIRVYEKVQSADTQRIGYQSILVGPQSPPLWLSPAFPLMHGWDVTLDAIVGTVTVTWSIRQLDANVSLAAGAISSATFAAGAIDSIAIATDAFTAAKFDGNSITAAALSADAVTEIQAGLATAAALTGIDSKLGTPTNLGGGATIAFNLSDIEAQTDDIGAAGAGLTALATQTSVNTIDDFLDTEVLAIKAVTDALPNAGALTTIQADLDDLQSKLGTPANLGGGATIAFNLSDIESQTDDIGVAGAGLSAIPGSSDPWATVLPAAYTAGQAGKIVGDNINATVSSRATPAQVNTEVDTALFDVGVTSTVTGRIDAALSTLATTAALAIVDDFLDTEIGAIKAKTDLIPGTIDGKTFSELVILIASALAGKVSGMGTTEVSFRSLNDTKNRITATVTSQGNRTAVTLDGS